MQQRKTTLRVIAALLLLCLLSTPLCSCLDARSIIGATVNDAGELILSYSDGTSQNLGVIKGADGEVGAPGLRGETGKNGKDGEDGLDGEKGEKGDVGETGEDGEDGVITIAPASDAVALATAKGLQSAVSIYCTFPLGKSAGAGVIWQMDENGNALIITNHHVVYNADDGVCDDIVVYLYGAEYTQLAIEAEYVGGSMYYDIAVLSVMGSEALKHSDGVAATLADSEQTRVGAQAIAVGNPKGIGISASLGIVSVDSEYITMLAADSTTQVSMRVMRIDTAVNSGNSGGGLYNGEGKLCGIVNAKISSTDVENIGYAIPSNLAVAVAQNIVDHCYGVSNERVKQARLGIQMQLLDSYAEADLTDGSMKIVQKVAIASVSSGTPAYGKLETGDVLVSVTLGDQTVAVTRAHHVTDLLLDVRAGDTLTFKVLRDDVETTVQIAITEANMVEY